jgi:hypothetical protein
MVTKAAPAPSGSSIYDALMGLEAPTIAQYSQSGAAAQAGLAELPASLNLQGAELGQTTALQQSQIANQLAGTGISSAGAAEQYGVSTQENQLSQLQNQQQLANTQKSLGLEQTLLGTQEGVAGGIEGLTQQELQTQQGQLNYNLPLQLQQQAGAAAAGGATNTVGNRNALATLGEQYGVASAGLKNQAGQAALNYQGQQAGFAEQGGQYALQGTEAQQQAANTATGIGLTQAGQTYAEGTTQAQLANTAQSLGISQEQLSQQLTSGLSQIGISGQQSQDQLLAQAATAQAGQSQGLGAVLSNVGALTGAGPQAFTGAFPNLYGSAAAGSAPGVSNGLLKTVPGTGPLG